MSTCSMKQLMDTLNTSVTAAWTATKADGAAVRLRVSDDGPGVPAHERTRIFDRFARGEGGDTRQGSGLGLAIVKGFADAMGMSVTIDDAPGGGACFTLVLPQAGRAGP